MNGETEGTIVQIGSDHPGSHVGSANCDSENAVIAPARLVFGDGD